MSKDDKTRKILRSTAKQKQQQYRANKDSAKGSADWADVRAKEGKPIKAAAHKLDSKLKTRAAGVNKTGARAATKEALRIKRKEK